MTSYTVDRQVARLVLDRPGALNAIDEETLDGLENAIGAVRADDSVKALVITGTADAFCVGLDIDLLGKAFENHAYFKLVLERLGQILLDLESLPVPVIAAVNGLARAGGFELLLAADIVVAAEDAKIGDNHLAFGIVPGGGSTQRAPRKIGEQRARELIYTGRFIDGREAERIGIALRAVPRVELDDAVEQIVARLRPLSRRALAATKAAIREGAALPLNNALNVELYHFMRFLDDDPKADEGYRAFVEKREPRWD